MNRTRALLGMAMLALVLTVGACDPVSGGSCNPIGKVVTDSNGQVWTCAKNLQTGNGYWYRGRL